jgi:hypothetical protein
MSTKKEFPSRTADTSNLGGDIEKHPAFGQIQFSRVQGNPGTLYGTHLDRHYGFVTMTLSRSQRRHNLSQDWYYANEQLVEVHLSFTQFAEMITAMNVGQGVPCTIRHLPGQELPHIAHQETEQKRVQSDFKAKIAGMAEESRRGLAAVESILAKPTIGKADREEIRNRFGKWMRLIEDSAPFVLDQFMESVERTAVAAKAEVDGFVTSIVHRTGLDALRAKKALTPGSNDDGSDSPDHD